MSLHRFSPIGNPLKTKPLQRSGPISNPLKPHDFYSSSAPSSSNSLHQSFHHTRPQVPLFPNNSTGSLQNSRLENKLGYNHPEGGVRESTSSSGFSSPIEAPENPGPQKDISVYSLPSGSCSLGTLSSTKLTPLLEYSPETMDLTDFMQGISAEEYLGSPDIAAELAHLDSFNQSTPASNSVQTISPKELTRDSYEYPVELSSAPPSTAFTNLTTPGSSYMDSFTANSADTSPLFTMDNNVAEGENWDSLFPSDDPTETPLPSLNFVVAPTMPRNRSSTGEQSSSPSNQGRHSFSSGITKRRRPTQPLPAIEVDPNDEKALRRARNTMAARKSRDKKQERLEDLMYQVAVLEQEVDHWKQIALKCGHKEKR